MDFFLSIWILLSCVCFLFVMLLLVMPALDILIPLSEEEPAVNPSKVSMSEGGNWFPLTETKSHNFDMSEKAPLFPPKFSVPIESLFTEAILIRLRAMFDEGPMTLIKFKDAVTRLLNLDRECSEVTVPILFNAVDTYRKGLVTFRNLCEYLYEDYQRRDTWIGEQEKMSLVVPGRIILPKLHRPPPVKMIELEDVHMLFSKDGTVSYWSKSFRVRKLKSLKTREMEKERLYEKVYCDVSVVEAIGKVIVSTSDKEIQFFDLQSLEPCCQVHGLPSSACSIEAKVNSQNLLIIGFGDWHGVVSVFALADAVKVLRNWSERPKVMGIASISWEVAIAFKEITAVAHWKVHDRRVDKVIYMELLGGQLISCSTDPNAALSIGCAFPPFSEHINFNGTGISVPRRPINEEQTYKIPFGIQTVDIWEEKRFLAAAGIDRVIRVWNMLTRGDAIGTLHGHVAPLRQIKFFPPVLVSISSQKSIRFWELKEFRCILVLNSTISKIRGQDVVFMNCSKMSNAVVVQTSEDLYVFQFRKKGGDDESHASHAGPVVAGQYNELLDVWITCSNVMAKIWDVRTGKKKSEFRVCSPTESYEEHRIDEELDVRLEEAIRKKANRKSRLSGDKKNFSQTKKKYYPNFSKPSDVTCMHVERMGNRLLTGHANGIVQEFNFVSGMKIRTMCKVGDTRESVLNSTINGVIYVKSALNDNILSVGWNRVVDVYPGGDSKRTEPMGSWTCYRGHRDDIWCVASAKPNILVTGSFEGLVLLWNFTAGKIEGRLLPPSYDENAEYDTNKVTSLAIYKQKDDPEELMYLFTAGPQSGMHMWEIYWKAKIFYYRGRIRPWRSSIRYFCSLSAAPQLGIVVAADNVGYVHVFEMGKVEPMKGIKYNQRGFEFNVHLKEILPIKLPEIPLHGGGLTTSGMPELRNAWLASSGGNLVLSIHEKWALLLTGDPGGRARIWNLSGHCIGTLGQKKEWDIQDSQTYLHPDIPAGVKDISSEYEVDLFEKPSTSEDETGAKVASPNVFSHDPQDFVLSDEEIGEKARFMTVYKEALPGFLKMENCFKVVYRSSLSKQKHSLAPVYKRNFDNELLEGLPKRDSS